MEAKGNLRKLFLAIMAVVVIQPAAFGASLGEKSKYVTSLVWEKAGNNPRVLAEMDGKALVLFEDENPHKHNFELIDLETGENLWEGVETDISKYVNKKPHVNHFWVYLNNLRLIYIKDYYSNPVIVTCYSVKDGSIVWQSPEGEDWPLPRCIENGIAYGFGSTGDYQKGTQFIVGYDLKTGKETSRVVTDRDKGGYNYNIFGKSGDVYYYEEIGSVVAFDINKNKSKRLIEDYAYNTTHVDDYRFVNGKIIAKKEEYLKGSEDNKKIVCFDTEKNEMLWTCNGLSNFDIAGNTVAFTSYERVDGSIKGYFTVFVDIATGNIINKIENNPNSSTFYNMYGDNFASITFYDTDSSLLTVFDNNGNVLDMIKIQSAKQFSPFDTNLFFTGQFVLLPCQGVKRYEYNNIKSIICIEIIDDKMSGIKLDTIMDAKNQKLLGLYRNFSILAKLDENSKISDLSITDFMTGKDILPNGNTPLEKALLGRSFDNLVYSFNNNEFFTTIFDGGKRKALGCFDILSGKQLWKSEKLKDCSPPTLYPFVSSTNGKDGDVYVLDKRYGWTTTHYILKNQSKPFSIVGINELAMIIFDGQYSMYYFKAGTKGWTSKDDLPQGANPLDAWLKNNVFVCTTSQGNITMLVAKDVFSGKILWTLPIAKLCGYDLGKIVALTKSKSGATEIAAIDLTTGKILDSKAISGVLTQGYSIKSMSVKNMLVTLYLEKPDKGSRVLVFGGDFEFLCMKDFEMQFFSKIETGIGRIALTLENTNDKSVETILMCLARLKKD